MKNKFNINEIVEHPVSKDKLIIRDLELIDNQYIYYFDGYLCFPEEVIKPYGFSMLKNIIEGKGIYSKENMNICSNNALDFVKNYFDTNNSQ